MNDLFRQRVTGDFAQRNVFAEARRALAERDDDEKGYGGLWRGEFWGKLMLSAARVADYLQDPQLIGFLRDECHRVMALQDPDGYIGSYRDRELVSIEDQEKSLAVYGWCPVWNLWGRKYTMWGMLEASRVTGDKDILLSVKRQMDQLVDMLHRRRLALHDTGTPALCGLPSMSLLKPLVLLYEATGERRYLDFAAEMLPDWDREDGAKPNLIRNAKDARALHDWYPEPWTWAKSYELMSCADGLVEYSRVTGDSRCLETARAICDNLNASEGNPLGGVGFGDMFVGAPQHCNALNEVCDIIHWIRLNVDLFLTTGDKHRLDAVERAYFNAYLAGIWRGGAFGPFFLRGHGRHTEQRGQCGYAYNHCCVNNLPRTFLDIATVAVTRDRAGTYHVNLYQDATVELEGVRFEISGNYPVGSVVTVRVSDPAAKVEFRQPDWCPKMDVRDGVEAQGSRVMTLSFDMNPRVVDRLDTVPAQNAQDKRLWSYVRYSNRFEHKDCSQNYRTTPAAQVMWGPLVLTKSRIIGNTRAEVEDPFTVNGKGYAVSATPCVSGSMTWGLWNLELTKSGERTVRVKACDFASGTDMPCGGPFFSIWF